MASTTCFGALIIGFCASAIEPPFVAEGVIIEETTEEEIKLRSHAVEQTVAPHVMMPEGRKSVNCGNHN
jgi:hypothetical protein